MLLLPAITIVTSLALAGFSLGLSKIQLEVAAYQAARVFAIFGESNGHTVTEEGRFSCLEIKQDGFLPITAKSCVFKYGG